MLAVSYAARSGIKTDSCVAENACSAGFRADHANGVSGRLQDRMQQIEGRCRQQATDGDGQYPGPKAGWR